MRSPMISVLLATLVVAAGAAAPAPAAGTDPADLPQNAGQWLSYGRDYSEQRYSPLKQINADTAGKLGLAWFGDLAERGGSYETTPVVVDGRIFVTSPWSKVYAFDAKTGKRLWKYDPHVPGEYAVKLCCGIVNRGVGVWKGKVIWGTLDGRLLAVDAKTGKKVWEIQATDPQKWLSITGAPRIADGRIFIGEAGSEFEERGYLACYSADTGKELWRWWSVPGDPSKGFEQPELAMAAKTWGGEWWKTGGGGTPWDGITYDPTTGYVYIGTGNGAPWPAEDRSPGSGDNLFTASVVAIEAKTGKYVWHYQETPAESFDFDSTAQITTADLVINGEKRHVVMHAPKNGIFYVLDAKTGKFISGKPFVPSVNWMSGMDADGRPILNPEANYAKTGKGFNLVGFQSHVWNPMSFNPTTGLMYVPTNYGTYPYVAELGAKMGNQLLGINIRCASEAAGTEDQRPRVIPAGLGPGKSEGGLEAARGHQPRGDHDHGRQPGVSGDRKPALQRLPGRHRRESLVGRCAGGNYRRALDLRDRRRAVRCRRGCRTGRIRRGLLGTELRAPAGLQARRKRPAAGESGLHTCTAQSAGQRWERRTAVKWWQHQYTTHCAGCHGNNQAGGRAVSSLFPDLRYAGALWSADAFNAIVLGGHCRKTAWCPSRRTPRPRIPTPSVPTS